MKNSLIMIIKFILSVFLLGTDRVCFGHPFILHHPPPIFNINELPPLPKIADVLQLSKTDESILRNFEYPAASNSARAIPIDIRRLSDQISEIASRQYEQYSLLDQRPSPDYFRPPSIPHDVEIFKPPSKKPPRPVSIPGSDVEIFNPASLPKPHFDHSDLAHIRFRRSKDSDLDGTHDERVTERMDITNNEVTRPILRTRLNKARKIAKKVADTRSSVKAEETNNSMLPTSTHKVSEGSTVPVIMEVTEATASAKDNVTKTVTEVAAKSEVFKEEETVTEVMKKVPGAAAPVKDDAARLPPQLKTVGAVLPVGSATTPTPVPEQVAMQQVEAGRALPVEQYATTMVPVTEPTVVLPQIRGGAGSLVKETTVFVSPITEQSMSHTVDDVVFPDNNTAASVKESILTFASGSEHPMPHLDNGVLSPVRKPIEINTPVKEPATTPHGENSSITSRPVEGHDTTTQTSVAESTTMPHEKNSVTSPRPVEAHDLTTRTTMNVSPSTPHEESSTTISRPVEEHDTTSPKPTTTVAPVDAVRILPSEPAIAADPTQVHEMSQTVTSKPSTNMGQLLEKLSQKIDKMESKLENGDIPADHQLDYSIAIELLDFMKKYYVPITTAPPAKVLHPQDISVADPVQEHDTTSTTSATLVKVDIEPPTTPAPVEKQDTSATNSTADGNAGTKPSTMTTGLGKPEYVYSYPEIEPPWLHSQASEDLNQVLGTVSQSINSLENQFHYNPYNYYYSYFQPSDNFNFRYRSMPPMMAPRPYTTYSNRN